MADISKCNGQLLADEQAGLTRVCVKRHQCYRFTAPSNEWRQAWMLCPLTIAGGEQYCDWHWPVEGK